MRGCRYASAEADIVRATRSRDEAPAPAAKEKKKKKPKKPPPKKGKKAAPPPPPLLPSKYAKRADAGDGSGTVDGDDSDPSAGAFDPSRPDGHYALDLADEGCREVAERLFRLEDDVDPDVQRVVNILLNGKTMREDPIALGWPETMPARGVLELDYVTVEGAGRRGGDDDAGRRRLRRRRASRRRRARVDAARTTRNDSDALSRRVFHVRAGGEARSRDGRRRRTRGGGGGDAPENRVRGGGGGGGGG